jgi:hypothetical protein
MEGSFKTIVKKPKVDPFEEVLGVKTKIAIIILSMGSILTCTLVGNYEIGIQALTHPSSSTLFVWEFA